MEPIRTYTIRICVDNDAFQGPAMEAREVSRILEGLVETMHATGELPRQALLDLNGNGVGKAYVAVDIPRKPPQPGEPDERLG